MCTCLENEMWIQKASKAHFRKGMILYPRNHYHAEPKSKMGSKNEDM